MYLLVIIGVLICTWASSNVRSTYAKYSRVGAANGMTGAQVAQQILWNSGINDVRIEHIQGSLTDNYDSRNKVLHLSDTTYNSSSVAAIGVAAHECGHAIQHATNYGPLAMRTAIVPVAQFGSAISWPLILVGLMMRSSFGSTLLNIGIIAFAVAILFQLVTLPVEFDASNRAINILSNGYLQPEEVAVTQKVLKAAALTYVANAASAILNFMNIFLLSRGRRR